MDAARRVAIERRETEVTKDWTLEREFAGMLTELLSRGFEAPLYAACIAVNGAVLVVRYEWSSSHEGLDVEMLAEHAMGEGLMMKLPLNIMFTDGRGEAARVVVHAPENTEWVH